MSERTRLRELPVAWIVVGIAIMACAGSGNLGPASAAGSQQIVGYVPIAPCRIMDTRPGADNVGPRSTPLRAQDTYTINAVGGPQGNCSLPAEATALNMNVTVVNRTAESFLTVFPTGPRPLSSSLNWTAGPGAVPNAVTTTLSAAGQVSFFNNNGSVDLLVDVSGYYIDPNIDGRFATTPITGDQVADFGLSNQDVGVLFAQVNSNGTVASHSGDVTGAVHVSTGKYEVSFDRVVSGCAFVVTQGEANAGNAVGAVVGATDRLNNDHAVFVTTGDTSTFIDNPFQLVVVC